MHSKPGHASRIQPETRRTQSLRPQNKPGPDTAPLTDTTATWPCVLDSSASPLLMPDSPLSHSKSPRERGRRCAEHLSHNSGTCSATACPPWHTTPTPATNLPEEGITAKRSSRRLFTMGMGINIKSNTTSTPSSRIMETTASRVVKGMAAPI